jgi:hypothetical protein
MNIALGNYALSANTTGNVNIAIGNYSQDAGTTGLSNVSLGYNSLTSNVSGSYNLAIGSSTLMNVTGSNENIAIGESVLRENTGEQNTGVGAHVLRYTTTGEENTALGYSSSFSNTTGTGNTSVGFASLFSNTTGTMNTAVGYFTNFNATAYTNTTAIGANVVVSGSNQVRVGSGTVTSIGGQVGWSTLSDARAKKQVNEEVHGLDFILKLRPVTYVYDGASMERVLFPAGRPAGPNGEKPELPAVNPMRFSGFLAQEVEAAAKSVGYAFSGVDAPKNENDLYGLRYAEFTVPLVKGMQEQQELIEELQQQNAQLASDNATIKADNAAIRAELDEIRQLLLQQAPMTTLPNNDNKR